MLKLWGSVLIVVAVYAIGQKLAESKRERLEFIESMLIALSDFKMAVEVFSLPLPKALEKSGIRGYEGRVSGEDEKDFINFLQGIKSETAEGQLSNIAAYERKLLCEEEEERKKYKKEAKLIKGGFLLFGLLITVVLI